MPTGVFIHVVQEGQEEEPAFFFSGLQGSQADWHALGPVQDAGLP